jgi:hypothetical protein
MSARGLVWAGSSAGGVGRAGQGGRGGVGLTRRGQPRPGKVRAVGSTVPVGDVDSSLTPASDKRSSADHGDEQSFLFQQLDGLPHGAA